MVALSVLGALYGAGGLTVILGVKTGVWTWRPLFAALLASTAFCALYAAMLAVAVFVRSAAVSAAAGAVLFVLGIVSSYRASIAPVFEGGLARNAFLFATSLFPRVASLADAGAKLAASMQIDGSALSARLVGFLVFSASALAVGIWHFEQKDF